MASKSVRTTPQRARLDAGEGGLEGVDGVRVDHRLMSLLVRDYLASVDQRGLMSTPRADRNSRTRP